MRHRLLARGAVLGVTALPHSTQSNFHVPVPVTQWPPAKTGFTLFRPGRLPPGPIGWVKLGRPGVQLGGRCGASRPVPKFAAIRRLPPEGASDPAITQKQAS